MYAPINLIILLVDIHSILDVRINGDVFLSLDESMLKQLGVSFGFKFTVMNIIENLVCSSAAGQTKLGKLP